MGEPRGTQKSWPRVLRVVGQDAQAVDLIDALEERGIYSRGDLAAALSGDSRALVEADLS